MMPSAQILSYRMEDISQEGIAFLYAGWQSWDDDVARLDFLDRWLFLEGVRVRVVSDEPCAAREPEGQVGPPLRRLGMQFVQLDDQQRLQLAKYLKQIKPNPASAQ